MSAAVLPRLRVGLPDELIADRAPVVPALPAPFSIRRAEPDADAKRVSEWMNRPHLVETWEQDWPVERWHADMSVRLAGDYSVPCIVGYEGRDVGYAELYWVAQDEVGGLYESRSHDTGLHLAIGESELRGKGIFSRFLNVLAEALAAADPECDLVLADPDHRNAAMRRALMKAGFTESFVAEVRPGRTIALAARGRAIEPTTVSNCPESTVSEVLS